MLDLAHSHFADLPARDAAAGQRPASTGAASSARRATSTRCISCWASPRSPMAIPTTTRPCCSPPCSAAACPRGCSRRCGRSAGWSIPIYSFTAPYMDGGLFGIYAGTGESEAAELMPVTLEELRKVQESVSEAELARARAQVKASLLMSLESTGSRCEQLARQIQVFGRVIPTEETVGKLNAVTTDDVRRAAARHLPRARPTLAALGPADARARPRRDRRHGWRPDTDERRYRPAGGPARPGARRRGGCGRRGAGRRHRRSACSAGWARPSMSSGRKAAISGCGCSSATARPSSPPPRSIRRASRSSRSGRWRWRGWCRRIPMAASRPRRRRADAGPLDLDDAAEPDAAALVARASAAEEAALAVPGITNSEGAEAGYGRTEIVLVTSAGFAGRYRAHQPLGLGHRAGRAGHRDAAGLRLFQRPCISPTSRTPAAIGRSAGERAIARLNPRGRRRRSCRWSTIRASRAGCSVTCRARSTAPPSRVARPSSRTSWAAGFSRRNLQCTTIRAACAACARGRSMARGCRAGRAPSSRTGC